jgi:membrane associated rhomboid family serine protease
MLPLHDTVPSRGFPAVTVALIAANLAVWLFYQVPAGLGASIDEFGFQPCEVEGSCATTGLPWAANAFTSMFTHGGWDHIVGNMVFLAIFGNNVEDALGRGRFLVFYLVGGLAATALQTWVTLQFGSAGDASIPSVGASGAIAAVLGAYFVLYPGGGIVTWFFPRFIVVIPAVVYLGLWIALQIVEGGASLTHPQSGGGTAYFAHIGGFLFGVVAVKLFSTRRPRGLQAGY